MNFKKEQTEKIEEIFEKNSVLFAYIFGSQASGKTNFESDIDIAVYLDEECEDVFKTRIFLIEALRDILKKNTEVIILNEQKSIFLNL